MAVLNGRLGASSLRELTYPRGFYLRADAAASFDRLCAAFARRHGVRLDLTDAYRSYERQEQILRQNYDHTWRPGLTVANGGVKVWGGRTWYRRPGYAVASSPGTSNHGLGVAVDIAGLGGFHGRYYLGLAQIAATYGWSNAAGRAINEPWHWEYDPGRDTHTVSGPVTSVPHAPDITTPGGGSPTPPRHLEEDDVPSTVYMHRTKAVPLTRGRWVGVPLNDKGYTSLLSGKHVLDTTWDLTVAGLTEGEALQVQVVKVRGNSWTIAATWPIVEIVGTSGSTFGQVTALGNLADGQRLRVRAKALSDGVRLTNVEARGLVW